MSSSSPFSSQAKLSAAATLDLPTPNWQPDLLFLPRGVCTKPYLYHGKKMQLRGDINTEHPLQACPGRRGGYGSCLCDTHAYTAVLIGLYTLQGDTGVNSLNRVQWMWLRSPWMSIDRRVVLNFALAGVCIKCGCSLTCCFDLLWAINRLMFLLWRQTW